MTTKRDRRSATNDELAAEAERWDKQPPSEGWEDAPHAIPSLEPLHQRALFYLDRRLAELQTDPVDHQQLAQRTVPYAERRRVEAQRDERQRLQHEREAWVWLRGRLLEM